MSFGTEPFCVPAHRPLSAGAALLTAFWAMLRERRASSAVEFALLLPLLLLFLLGTVQAGIAFFAYNATLNTAREAVRQLAVGTLSSGTATFWITGELPSWVRSAAVTVAVPDASSNLYVVSIVVPLKTAAIIDPLGLFGTSNLTARVSTTAY